MLWTDRNPLIVDRAHFATCLHKRTYNMSPTRKECVNSFLVCHLVCRIRHHSWMVSGRNPAFCHHHAGHLRGHGTMTIVHRAGRSGGSCHRLNGTSRSECRWAWPNVDGSPLHPFPPCPVILMRPSVMRPWMESLRVFPRQSPVPFPASKRAAPSIALNPVPPILSHGR